MKMSKVKNKSYVYLYIIEKQSIRGYEAIQMPGYYTGTIRDESKMGYSVLRCALEKEFSLNYDPKSIKAKQDGKPFIENSPLCFNLSNCQNYIACAVGHQELGVDIEQNRPVETKLLEKILTPEEISNSFNPLQAWVTKEAYSKFLGVGMKLGFATTSTEDLQTQHPNIMVNKDAYMCALFYANPETKVQINYSINEERGR